ncbi:hypothetical protein AVEN_215196-1 [Araneus ventricosus]|uniref:Uncharacterized protein n=1 Tax=Araneus ventricosus TaxID=182803 RepID=A0A4Y2NA94_ARAVE|nr:hypothetical protein AVEN_215196-1 [Araneus ventricosus]
MDDLVQVVEKLSFSVTADAKFIDIKRLLVNSDVYESEWESVENIVDNIYEDRSSSLEAEIIKQENDSKLKIERAKHALLEKQLEIERIKKHFREVKNCVQRSYSYLELEVQRINGNCNDPFSTHFGAVEEQTTSKGHQPAESEGRKGIVSIAKKLTSPGFR